MSLINSMQQAYSRAQTNVGYTRLGIISSVNPANSTVKVLIQPEEVETNFIAFTTPWIGWYAPPTPGQQCVVHFQEGDKSVPVACELLYFLNGSLPPANVESGEAILYHTSGSYIKLSNDGKIDVNSTDDVNVQSAKKVNITATDEINLTAPTINLNGNAVVSGTLSADNGSVTASGGNFATTGSISADGNVTGNGISLDSHVHSGVESGSDNTGGPV